MDDRGERPRTATMEAALHNVHPLDPRGDGTVSRIVGRRETRRLQESEARADAAVERLVREVAVKLIRKSRLERRDLKKVAALVGYSLGAADLVLSREVDDRADRASSPYVATGFTSLSAKDIVETPDGRYAGSATFARTSVRVDRSSLSHSWTPAWLDWRQHVADRLHLRGDDRGDAHATIAKRLHATMRTTTLLGVVARDVDGDLTIPLPLNDGLAMGILDAWSAHPPAESNSRMWARDGTFQSRLGGGVNIATPFNPERVPATWTGVTYLSAAMVGERGRTYAAAFRDLDARVRSWICGLEENGPLGGSRDPEREGLLADAVALLRDARHSGLARRGERATRTPFEANDFKGKVAHRAFERGIDAAVEKAKGVRGYAELSTRTEETPSKGDGRFPDRFAAVGPAHRFRPGTE